MVLQSVVMTNKNNKFVFVHHEKNTLMAKYHAPVEKHRFLGNKIDESGDILDESIDLVNHKSFRRQHNYNSLQDNNQSDDVIFYSGSLNQKIPKLRKRKTLINTSRAGETVLPILQSTPEAVKSTSRASINCSTSAVANRRCSKQNCRYHKHNQQVESIINTAIQSARSYSESAITGGKCTDENRSLSQRNEVNTITQSTTTKIIQSCRREREVDTNRALDMWDLTISSSSRSRGSNGKTRNELGRFRGTADKTIKWLTKDVEINKDQLHQHSSHNDDSQQQNDNINDLDRRIQCFMLLAGKPSTKTPLSSTMVRKLHNVSNSQLYSTKKTTGTGFNNPFPPSEDRFVGVVGDINRKTSQQQEHRRRNSVPVNQNRRISVSSNQKRKNSVSANQNRRNSVSSNQNKMHSFSVNPERTRSALTNQKTANLFSSNRKNVEVTSNYYNRESSDKSRYLRYPSSPILSVHQIFK